VSTRDRSVLGILAVAAAIAAVWFMAVAPKRHEAADLGAQVAQAQVRRDAATTRAATAEHARATYPKDYATVARLGKAVPSHADVASLLFQLETAARAAKVDFRSVTVDSSPTKAPVPPAGDAAAAKAPAAAAATGTGAATQATVPATTIDPRPFTFSFEGTFAGLRRLLAAIDRFSRVGHSTLSVSGRLLTVDTVVMTAGRGGLPNVKADIVAKAYIASMPVALPGARLGIHSTLEVAIP
jgi:hypothetical protein